VGLPLDPSSHKLTSYLLSTLPADRPEIQLPKSFIEIEEGIEDAASAGSDAAPARSQSGPRPRRHSCRPAHPRSSPRASRARCAVTSAAIIRNTYHPQRPITGKLIIALGEEISAIKESGGSEKIGIHDGRYGGTAAGHFLYVFLVDSELNVPSDTLAQLFIDKDSYEAIVVNLQGFEITLSLSENLGPSIPKATLSLSAYFLLEQLKRRRSEVSAGELPVNRDMCLQVFGLQANGSITDAQRLAADAELNDEQLEAVNRSLAQRVTFIWGPPGTGKTRTIGGLVRALVRHGERVLVTSHTNIAVDTALLRVIKAMDPKQIEDGLVVRVGALALKDPELPPVTMESVLERKSRELRRRQEELAIEKKRTQALRDKVAATIRAIEAAQKAEQRVAAAGAALAKAEEKLKEAEKAILKARWPGKNRSTSKPTGTSKEIPIIKQITALFSLIQFMLEASMDGPGRNNHHF